MISTIFESDEAFYQSIKTFSQQEGKNSKEIHPKCWEFVINDVISFLKSQSQNSSDASLVRLQQETREAEIENSRIKNGKRAREEIEIISVEKIQNSSLEFEMSESLKENSLDRARIETSQDSMEVEEIEKEIFIQPQPPPKRLKRKVAKRKIIKKPNLSAILETTEIHESMNENSLNRGMITSMTESEMSLNLRDNTLDRAMIASRIESEFSFNSTENSSLANLSEKSEQDKFKCDICDKKYSQKKNLVTHMKAHTKPDELKCQICGQQTTTKQHLNRHLKIHSENREKNLKCSECDYKTDYRGNLNWHLKTHSENRKKEIECPDCDYKTDRRRSLNLHLKRKHEK